jgi:UDP-N-acetylglucosamine acyltransferase
VADIHPSSIVDAKARLGEGVKVGPFTIIGPDVVLGDNVTVFSHSIITGRTEIGAGSKIYPFVNIGGEPQDVTYKDEPTGVKIGERCTIRENDTIHRGTMRGHKITTVGNNCLIMVGSHVAHDCVLGDNVTMVNGATIGGHVQVGDYAILGGLSGVQQRLRIGAHAFVGGHSGIGGDLIPFGIGVGRGARLGGLNLVGLKRRGFTREAIHALRNAYKEIFFGEGTLGERLSAAADKHAGVPEVMSVVQFIREAEGGPICVPREETED